MMCVWLYIWSTPAQVCTHPSPVNRERRRERMHGFGEYWNNGTGKSILNT